MVSLLTIVCWFAYSLVGFSSEVVLPITPPVQHAEGPHWDCRKQVLYFVDTFSPSVLQWNPRGSVVTYHNLDGNSVGIIVPISGLTGRFLLCQDRQVNLFCWDGANNNSGTWEVLTLVDEDKPYNQFNDGKADAKGRLWAGTLTRNKDQSVEPFGGSLFKFSRHKFAPPHVMMAPVSISNGMAWSKDSKWFFYIDSQNRTVTKFAFGIDLGTIGSPEILFDLGEHPHLSGLPDGMTIDTDDNLWVALYGGKSVIKINSTTGKLLQVVGIPATYVTSVAFGGSYFDVLYVTTSMMKLTFGEMLLEPHAGCVFAVYNLGVRGRPAHDFVL